MGRISTCSSRAMRATISSRTARRSALLALDAAGPDRQLRGGVEQLDVDAHDAVLHPHAAVQHVAHLKLGGDGGEIGRLALVPVRSLARDHAEDRNARQDVGQVVRHHVGEQLRRVGGVAERRERQHRKRDDVARPSGGPRPAGARRRFAVPPAPRSAAGVRAAHGCRGSRRAPPPATSPRQAPAAAASLDHARWRAGRAG